MSKTVLYINGSAYKKAKLPRKRKKAAINAQGRKWYKDTITLFYVMAKNGTGNEKVCKFWVNDSIKPHAIISGNGSPTLIPMATKFW